MRLGPRAEFALAAGGVGILVTVLIAVALNVPLPNHVIWLTAAVLAGAWRLVTSCVRNRRPTRSPATAMPRGTHPRFSTGPRRYGARVLCTTHACRRPPWGAGS